MSEVKDNKQTLIKSALSLFAHKGFDGVSTMEIVEAANVTKPTMYYYFGSKEGLLQEILSTFYGNLIEGLSKAVSLPEDIPLTFFRLSKVYFDTAVKYSDFFLLRAGLNLRYGEDTAYLCAKKYLEHETSIIYNFFSAATNHAGNLKGKEDLCTISFIGTINATISSYLQTGNEDLISDETIYRLRQQFLYGIYS